jgi:hypothetical protein
MILSNQEESGTLANGLSLSLNHVGFLSEIKLNASC